MGTRALCAGPGAARRGEGTVEIALHPGGYIRLGDEYALLAVPRAPRGPLTILVSGLERAPLQPGDPAVVAGGHLHVGGHAIALDVPLAPPPAAGPLRPGWRVALRAALAAVPAPPAELADGLAALRAARAAAPTAPHGALAAGLARGVRAAAPAPHGALAAGLARGVRAAAPAPPHGALAAGLARGVRAAAPAPPHGALAAGLARGVRAAAPAPPHGALAAGLARGVRAAAPAPPHGALAAGSAPRGVCAAAPAAPHSELAAGPAPPGALARAVAALAGRGEGLTPAGDDVLAGFAAWCHAAGRPVALAQLAAGAASPIGLAYLRCADRGELPDVAARVVAAVRAGDVDAARRRARALSRWGASSGAAILWGVASAT